MTKRLKIGLGEQITISGPLSTRYDIVLPRIYFGWDYAQETARESRLPELSESAIVVTPSSPLNLRRAAETLATYFQREFHYDFVQYESDRPTGLVWLWKGTEAIDYERVAAGAVHFKKKTRTDGSSFWSLNWAWFHPYERRHGKLSSAWKFFRDRFGEFYIEQPVSPSMRSFLQKTGDLELLTPPSSGSNAGDWDTVCPADFGTKVPEVFALEAEDSSSSGSTGFISFLEQQKGREDMIGDLSFFAEMVPEWPQRGSIADIWEFLIDYGCPSGAIACLRAAWNEYLNGPPDVEESTHARLGTFFKHSVSEMTQLYTILTASGAPHPAASQLLRLVDGLKNVRYRLKGEASESGYDTDLLYPPLV